MRWEMLCYGLLSGFQWQIYKEGAYGRKGQGQSRPLTIGGVRGINTWNILPCVNTNGVGEKKKYNTNAFLRRCWTSAWVCGCDVLHSVH